MPSIATTYAETGSAYVVPSAMSRVGIVAMTRSLAVEWGGEGIRLNAIAPGPFPTEGAWDRLVPDEGLVEQMKDRIPMDRFGSPDELAALASILLSDLTAYMNGEVATFDGGKALSAGGQFNTFARTLREQVKAMMEQMRPDWGARTIVHRTSPGAMQAMRRNDLCELTLVCIVSMH